MGEDIITIRIQDMQTRESHLDISSGASTGKRGITLSIPFCNHLLNNGTAECTKNP